MKLHGFWRSTATWRVRIALAHKGIVYEYVPVKIARTGGEQDEAPFREKNPMGRVPVLEMDGRRLAESMAILEMLEETHPTPPLLPKDAFLRARARQLAMLVVSGIQPLQNTSVQHWVESELHADGPAWISHWVTHGLGALESLTRETAGKYSVGDEISFADVCLVPELYFARRFSLDLAPYPTLVRIDEACSRLPAFEAAHATRQPDAPGT
jgi:maleylpyruvate isomerase